MCLCLCSSQLQTKLGAQQRLVSLPRVTSEQDRERGRHGAQMCFSLWRLNKTFSLVGGVFLKPGSGCVAEPDVTVDARWADYQGMWSWFSRTAAGTMEEVGGASRLQRGGAKSGV